MVKIAKIETLTMLCPPGGCVWYEVRNHGSTPPYIVWPQLNYLLDRKTKSAARKRLVFKKNHMKFANGSINC